MIVCPYCCNRNIRTENGCPKCGFIPARVDGFWAWAPDLAKHNDGFPKESFEGLVRVEAGNFWFRARNTIILWALRKYFPGFDSLLEVGCGTGYVLSGIADAFPNAHMTGSEIYTAGLSFAAKRLPGVELLQMDARKFPYAAEFDVVAAFDVIEHILEDKLVLQNFYHAIKPGGGCLITVPQHQWLWSHVDEAACHKRRYSVTDLHTKVEAAGFRIVRSTSFVTLLLPLMLVSRFLARRSESAGYKELLLNPVLDRTLEAIMQIEYFMIKAGISLPFGGSRMVILKREVSP